MAAPAEFFWRILADVRANERSRFLFFAGLLTLISMAQTMGLAGSEALFLAEIGVERLAPAFITASLVTVLGSMLYALRVGSARNDDLFIQLLAAAGILLVGSTVAVAAGAIWILPVLFCFWYLAEAVFLNHFWTFSGDYFDTLSSKRLIPLFTIGSSVGGVLGGLSAAALTQWIGPAALIAGWGLLFGMAALLLRLARRPLRRWGPLELEEADETSVEGIQGALRFLRRSSLARWLVVSAIGMVLALFLAQYLYSDIFARRFPDPTRLAVFLSIYFAATNLIEIVFEVAITPWVIRRMGVASANLIHPIVMMFAFAGLIFRFGMPAGVGARMARELMDNSMASPVRALIYNAMPPRFRGRLRAFLEGIVVYAGMSVAGVVLLLVQNPDPRWLCAAGGAAACFYLAANWKVRRAYLETLVGQLRAGRLDLAEVGDELGSWEAERLAEMWETILREEGRRPSRSLLQMIPGLAARGVLDPLVRAASHRNADVRRSCLNALASTGETNVSGVLALALDDPEPNVRLAALRGLSRVDTDPSFLASRIGDLLDDLDPQVRSEAALRAGADGAEILSKMILSSTVAEATAAMKVAPPALLDAVASRSADPDAAVRAASLECLARLSPEPPLDTDELLAALGDADARVRRAAVLMLANLDDDDAPRHLASCLTDPSTPVQSAAETVLGSLGEKGLAAVEPYLHSDLERAVEGALRVVSGSSAPGAQALLSLELRRRVREMWYEVIAFQNLPAGDSLAHRFLGAAYADAMLRSRRLAFRVLAVLENPDVIRKVDRELRVGSSRSRSDALEVLSNLGDRESAHLLVLMHEPGSLDERARAVSGIVPVPTDPKALLAAARHAEMRWIRMAAEAIDPSEGQETEEETMERLLALKQVDLFANLSLEQLEAVHQVTEEADYLAGELIMQEGEPGDSLCILLEGAVRIVKNIGTDHEIELATMTAVDYLGEMAILDDQPRSASAIAANHVRLLSLDGASLKDLINQMPEISFEMLRVLTGRVRAAEARLSDVD